MEARGNGKSTEGVPKFYPPEETAEKK